MAQVLLSDIPNLRFVCSVRARVLLFETPNPHCVCSVRALELVAGRGEVSSPLAAGLEYGARTRTQARAQAQGGRAPRPTSMIAKSTPSASNLKDVASRLLHLPLRCSE